MNAVNFRKKSRHPRGKKGDTDETTKACSNCRRIHKVNNCFARGKTCGSCGKLNHFAAVCCSGKRRDPQNDSSVKAVEQEFGPGEESDKIYVVSDIAAVTLDNAQLVSLRLESGNYLRFQPDTGAQCNVIPVQLYKKAANNSDLKQVNPATSVISAYGGSQLPVVGQVTLRVWRDSFKCLLDCKLVDCKDIRSILGRKACIGMNIIKYSDNDAIHKPTTGNASVYSVDDNLNRGMSKERLLNQFPDVFAEEVGQLDGEYHIKIDPAVSPVQHPPRRVPVAMREKLKSELQHMTAQNIIAPVTTPTPWVSSLVAVPKGSQGPKPGDSERTLPSPYNRGCSNSFTRSQGVHETQCQKWLLARQTRKLS